MTQANHAPNRRMPAASQTVPCTADCPCQKHTSLEVVPYRETEDCPTDELLLEAWWHGECLPCLTWWVERVWRDPRYNEIVRQVQATWPRVDVSDLRQTVVVEVYQQKNSSWRCVGASFRSALWYKAFDEHRRASQVRTQVSASDADEGAATTAALVSSQHLLELLDDCLQRLSEKETRLKDAVYDQRMSLVEVAKCFQQTHGAVLKQVSRLRAKLRVCIESKE